MALKRSRSSATMPAHSMPPSTPASSTGTTMKRLVSGPACIAIQPAHSAPTMNCPSAPMFQMLERKHTASPSAISTSGVALMLSSLSA